MVIYKWRRTLSNAFHIKENLILTDKFTFERKSLFEFGA
jgi:hypothetical protein